MIHSFTRRDLYNVSTERLMGRSLRIHKSFWPWSKAVKVREYATYECIGEHPRLFGQFAFTETDYTEWEKHFDDIEEARAFIREETAPNFDPPPEIYPPRKYIL